MHRKHSGSQCDSLASKFSLDECLIGEGFSFLFECHSLSFVSN